MLILKASIDVQIIIHNDSRNVSSSMVGSFEYYVFDYGVVGAFDFCVVGAFDYSVVGGLVYGVLTVVVAMGLADQPEKPP